MISFTRESEMDLKLEPKKFEELEALFIAEIVEKIKIKLMESGITGTQLEDLTANIAFSVAATIDDTADVEADGVRVRPYLTFKTEGDEIIHCGENSFTQEYVYNCLKKLFEN